MQQSNFMLLFRTLSRREMLDFDHFLKALYPQHEVCHSVFDYCLQYQNKTDDKYWEKEQAFAEIFSTEIYDQKKRKKLTDALSDLNLRLQEFLLWQKSRNKSFERSFAILKIYKERKLHELLLQGLKLLRKQLMRDQSGQNMWWNLCMAQVFHTEFYEAPIPKLQLKENPLHGAIKHLIAFYRGALLKYACEVANRAFILQEKYEIEGLEEVLLHLSPDNSLQRLYRQFYDLLKKRDGDSFQKAKKELLSQKNYPVEEVEVCLTYLINLGIQFSKKGDLFYTRELLDLYQYGLKKKIFLIDNKLQSTKFLNIIELACKAGELSWADYFIKTYKSYLPKSERLVVINLGQAIIDFAKEDFSSVLILLRDLRPKTVEHVLRTRALTLCALVEENTDDNTILDYCTSFQIYLRRNTVIGQQTREGFQNFIKIVNHLVQRKKNRQKIEDELNDAKAIFMKYWLQKQIDKYVKL